MARKLVKSGGGNSGTGEASSRGASLSTSTANSASSTFSAPSVLTDGLALPRLVVFDLDYTLWPFWVDTHVSPPLKHAPSAPGSGPGAGSGGGDHHKTAAVDKFGETFAFYADVHRILHTLPAAGVRLGVASRTHAPDLARDLLKLLHVPPAASALSGGGDGVPGLPSSSGGGLLGRKDKARKAVEFFDAGLEMYPTSKLRHMEALQKRTGIPYTEILFFDDESRNRDVEQLGVTMWLVRDGMTWDEVEKGVREWRKRNGVVKN